MSEITYSTIVGEPATVVIPPEINATDVAFASDDFVILQKADGQKQIYKRDDKQGASQTEVELTTPEFAGGKGKTSKKSKPKPSSKPKSVKK